MDKLGSYKLNKAFTKGVDIRLDGAPDVVFKVKLPSQYNRGYTQAMYGSIDWDVGDDGNISPKGNIMETRYNQQTSFVAHCLVSMDGEDIPEGFIDEYPSAVDELMEKATELANAIEEKVANSVGKSQTSSTGKRSGEVNQTSTSASLKEAG